METMAWHFAVMPSFEFPGEGREMVDTPSDGQPSVTSIFIAKDQKLTDLSEPFRKHFNLGHDTWLVWNESRKLLIAHGTPITLWQVENESGYMHQPRQVALTISWYLGVEPGKPIPPDLQPLHSTTIVGRSGQTSAQAWRSSPPARFLSEQIEAESTSSDDHQYVHSILDLRWEEFLNGKAYFWRFNGAAFLKSTKASKTIFFQADSPAGGSWTLTAESSLLLSDGHPMAEGRLLEAEGKEVAYSEHPKLIESEKRRTIQTSKGEMLLQSFPAWDFFRDDTGNPGIEVDPFSSATSESPLKTDDFQITSIPEELKAWVPQQLIDVKARLKSSGIAFTENGLAGFDRISGRLFVADFDSGLLNMVEQLTGPTCNLRSHHVTVLENLASSNKEKSSQSQKALIACLSGGKSFLKCHDKEESTLFNFEVEPTIGDSDQLVDLRFRSARKEPAHSHESSLTLPVGIEVKSSTTNAESGDQLTESLKVTVTRLGGPD